MRLDLINNINAVLADYFRNNPAIGKIPAKDLMPLFVSKAIFANDYKNGLPIRSLLRSLDKSDELRLIPYVLAERKSANTSWYFIPSKNSSGKLASSKPATNTINKLIPKSSEGHLKSAFPPIVNERCRVLILGSLPGDESLRKGEYYANPRNGFWKIVGLLFHGIPESYERRCDWLLNNEIALWDVLANGKRIGSLDSNIKSSSPNDFSSLFKRYPSIKYIFFNGSKSKEDYVKYIGIDKEHVFGLLPSSSSARAMAFELKVREWELIANALSK